MGEPPEMKIKGYLGDSVYAGFDGTGVWVWTENGFGPNNDAICFDPETFDALESFVKRCSL